MWKKIIADRKIIAAGDLFLVKLASERKKNTESNFVIIFD